MLFSKIDDLIKYIYSKNVKITLSTNAILLKKHKKIIPFLYSVGIPLDGSNNKLNSIMRIDNNHFDTVFDVLNMISKKKSKPIVKIRTVITKKNKNDIENIAKILRKNKSKFNRWIIYEYVSRGRNEKYRDEFYISSKTTLEIYKSVLKDFPDLNAEFCTNKSTIKKYVFIDPSGKIYGITNADKQYTFIGNFFKEKLKFLSKIKQIYDCDF